MLKIHDVFIHTTVNQNEKLSFNQDKKCFENGEDFKSVYVNTDKNIIGVEAVNNKHPYNYQEIFLEYGGISIELETEAVAALGDEVYSPFWARPAFAKDLSELPHGIKGLLLKNKDGGYTFVLPICNDEFKCSIKGGTSKNTFVLEIAKLCGGYTEMKGICAVISKDQNPYNAVEKAHKRAVEEGLILTPLRDSKKYPPMFEYLGWCSWNAFYHDVTEEALIAKAKEFNDKNIPVKWFMIDDGWSCFDKYELTDFKADKNKFPEGLSHTSNTLKKEYGLDWVGVWHSMTGYWYGVKENSHLFEKCRDILLKVNSGRYIPKPENSYDFFGMWHRYLKKEGIDFLKVDCQGNLTEFLKGYPEPCKKIREYQTGFERSAEENFDSMIIDCMGLDNINCQTRTSTAMLRNSDDFYPKKEDGFASHAMQNAYNAIFNRDLYYCDFDMWWTNHKTAKESAMLRAVSGGPVYVSDKLSETVSEALLPLADKKGKILRCDECGRATEDCLFTDPVKDKKVLKVFNTKGRDGVVGLFNLCDEPLEVTVSQDDFYGVGSYMAYIYTKKLFTDEKSIKLTIEAGKSEIINFYHIKDGYVSLGDLTKYISVADENKKQVKADELLKNNISEFGGADI